MPDFEVRRDDLRATRLVERDEPSPLEDGQVRFRIDRFGLTANNVTYGVLGDFLRYWSFYPASADGWGRIPVWGYGDVVESAADGIGVGERFYGFLPMSSHVTLRARAGGPGFGEVSDHRADLPGVYNQYLRVDPDAPYADEQLLLRPLFATSFLIEDYLRAHEWFGAAGVVLSSASSKTAYGTAFMLQRADDRPEVIGLTSEGNRGWVESLGLYDRVITYDAIETGLAGTDALVYVDMAGDTAVREAVHGAAADRLRHSVMVGATHGEPEAMDADPDLPGPTPEFFFAPTQIARLTESEGPGWQRRLGAAFGDVAPRLGDWMKIERGAGPDALERTWLALVDGTADPARGYVVSVA